MENNKIIERFNHLLGRLDGRKAQVTKFIKKLENETAYFTAPASTRFHLNRKGGLLEHSVGVTETLLQIKETLAPWISDESCIIVGLFHDLGKAGMPGKPLYLPNPDQWQAENRNRKYIVNPDLTTMDIAVRSLYLVAQNITLTEEEAQAIAYHDGQYLEGNKIVAHQEESLTLLLQYADNWTASVLEDEDFGETILTLKKVKEIRAC